MFKKISKLKIVFIIILLALSVYFISQNLTFFVKEQKVNNIIPIIDSTSVSYQQENLDFGLPVQIRIPKIGVDTIVEQVGITSQGEIGVPEGPTGVVWFNLGPHPGENGSAVITGHYGWKDGIVAVFDNLYKLEEGDKIYIEDDKGKTITFVMRESRRYDPEADSSDVFISNDNKSHLNLITCEGVWNKDQKSYSKRLVVFADRE
jgi:LPXTG-site transpeptidase (sortase) family protein